jgi:DNA-binding NarL/FixJ family response regulator
MSEGSEVTRVLVVEDHAALGDALLFAFSFEEGIEVVGLAPTVKAALEMVTKHRPDVVLMDVRLPDGNGLDATSQALEVCPGTAVIVLTAHADPVFALRAAEAGASGFLSKDVRIAKIVAAIRAVTAGKAAVEPTMLRSLLAQAAAEGRVGVGDQPRLDLPRDQIVVLDLLAQGVGSVEIAEAMGIEFDEVGPLVDGSLSGLGARSRLEAVMLAARRGVLGLTAGS